MSIICLSGPDGSGKSTLAQAVKNKIELKNNNVIISWMRGSHTLASILAKLLSNSTAFRGEENPYYDIEIPKKMRRLWQLIEFLSALPVILFRFVIPAMLGWTVICDRYVPDFLVWIALTTDDKDYPDKLEARFLLKLSKRYDYTAYIYASPKKLEKRSKEDDTGLGSRQLPLYEDIAERLKAEKIDTTHEKPEESLERILKGIEKVAR